ncbi:MAG TPA: hypothetical protein PLH57_04545 [Oligoflexia bacterium]|nr:hypothetical protein [Oligoflexia bacterium]
MKGLSLPAATFHLAAFMVISSPFTTFANEKLTCNAQLNPRNELRRAAIGTLAMVAVGSAVVYTNNQSEPKTERTSGTIVDRRWKHTVTIEAFEKTQKTAWLEEVPNTPPKLPVNGKGEVSGAENIVCREELFRRDPCRLDHRESSCPEAIYREKCTFDTYVWVFKESFTVPHSDRSLGPEVEPWWPTVTLGPLERPSFSKYYEVRILLDITDRQSNSPVVTEPRLGTYEVASEEEFLKWVPGQKVEVDLTRFGQIKGLRKLK